MLQSEKLGFGERAMAWVCFIDESGQDHRASPYEVLAGVAIHDKDIGRFVKEMEAAEIKNFGRRYSSGAHELKGKKILKTKVWNHTKLNVAITDSEVVACAKKALDDGANAVPKDWKGLAIAKFAYVKDVLDLVISFGGKVFASVVETGAPQGTGNYLRKDYAYLFERFYYFLEDKTQETGFPEQGVIVFDELEKTRSHILLGQLNVYFRETATGRQRASLIIPEPFFVHSDLTTGVQIADLVAYCISWGFRTPQMTKPKRAELDGFAAQIARMRHRSIRERQGNQNFQIWSIAHVRDLRTNIERLADEAMSEE
jgi:uncharacterized protein DUF3800